MRILNTVGCGVAVVPTTADFEQWKTLTQAQVSSKSSMVKRGNNLNLIMIELSLKELQTYRDKYEREIKESYKEKGKENLSESEIWTALAGSIGTELFAQKRIKLM